MNKKIIFGCIGIVFMLVAITMVSAVNTKTTEMNESPLFKIRKNNAILNIKEKIKIKYNRIIFAPFFILNENPLFNNYINQERFFTEQKACTMGCGPTSYSVCPCLNDINILIGDMENSRLVSSDVPKGYCTSGLPTTCEWRCN